MNNFINFLIRTSFHLCISFFHTDKSKNTDRTPSVLFIEVSACYLRPSGYAVDARYGATCFACRSTNGLRNFVAPLSVCLAAKAARAKGKAPSRNRNFEFRPTALGR